MVRQAHHPEQGRRVNLKSQYSMTKTLELRINVMEFSIFDEMIYKDR
jgi:hypothetical protein